MTRRPSRIDKFLKRIKQAQTSDTIASEEQIIFNDTIALAAPSPKRDIGNQTISTRDILSRSHVEEHRREQKELIEEPIVPLCNQEKSISYQINPAIAAVDGRNPNEAQSLQAYIDWFIANEHIMPKGPFALSSFEYVENSDDFLRFIRRDIPFVPNKAVDCVLKNRLEKLKKVVEKGLLHKG